jgi:hypothetical protein
MPPMLSRRNGLQLVLSALFVCLVPAVLAPAAGAAEGTVTVKFQHESLPAYEAQLAHNQVAAVTFNKKLRTVRVTLKNGQHVLAQYPPHQEPRLAAALAANGVPVTILKKKEAEKEAPKPTSHKLRYLAGAILVVVIVVVGIVLYISRRRKREEEY